MAPKEKKTKPRKSAEKKATKRKNSTKTKAKKNGPIAKEQNKQAVGAKRARADSIEETVKIAQAAHRVIEPPAHVRMKPKDLYFWDSIIAEFAKIEWTDHALEMAAILARTMADLEKEQHIMRKEGGIIAVKNKEGVVIGQNLNPRKQLIDMHNKNVMQMRRSLSLHARAQGGERRDIEKRRAIAKDVEGGFNSDDDDGLFAKPTIN